MELYFAKLFGLYFIIMGAIILWRRKAVMPSVAQLAANRPVLLSLAVVQLAAGLALIIVFPDLTWSVSGMISVIGYMLIVEGILYLAAPARVVQKMIRYFNTPQWFTIGGALSLLGGAYLAGVGFGFF